MKQHVIPNPYSRIHVGHCIGLENRQCAQVKQKSGKSGWNIPNTASQIDNKCIFCVDEVQITTPSVYGVVQIEQRTNHGSGGRIHIQP